MKNKEIIKRLYNIVKNKAYLVIISVIIVSITSFVSLEGPYLLGQMTNILADGIKFDAGKIVYNIDYVALKRQFNLIMLLYASIALISCAQGLMMSVVGLKLELEITNMVNAKINRLPISYLDKTLNGSIISLVVNDVYTLSQAFFNLLIDALPSVITIIGTIILMFTISFKLTLIVLVFVPITLLVIATTVIFSQKYFKRLQEKLGLLNAHIEEMYSNHDVILAFNGQDESIDKFERINNDLFTSSFLSQFLSGLPFPVVTILNNISYAFISLVGSVLLFNGQLNIGMFQTFIQYLNGFHGPLSMMSQLSGDMQQIKATSERIFNFLDEKEMSSEDSFEAVNFNDIKGNISFENVDFSYDGNRKIIKNLSFDVKAGEKVAIVGHTGSGKTTIINLLMKFYDISSGDIKIDGRSIKTIKREDIANMFTMVLQDTWLFEGTILSNIKFSADNDVSFEEVKKASKNANSHHFIKTLPNSYNMVLNEQLSNISIGQKQQLTIARAFLKNSKMLILDEATSSVDSRTEKLIQESMKKLMEDKTTFIIAHRLSTIKDCDKIILLKDGEIIEMGNHKELLELGGEYAKLYNA